MSGVGITGVGVVAATGVGREPFAAALAAPGGGGAPSVPVPTESPHVIAGFDVRAQLGRKGTTFLNRCTGIALVACGEALRDSGLADAPVDRDRVGVSLGTTTGSLQSMSDYTRDTLEQTRPYLVNPGLFPNTVMNCASGQTAIYHRLRGVNSTIAAGPVAFFGVLRCAIRSLRRGELDAVLAGAVEEFSEQRAWQTHLAGVNGHRPAVGEGAAVTVLERTGTAQAAGRPVDVEIESVVSGFCPGGEGGGALPAALRRTAARALADAGIGVEQVATAGGAAPADSAMPSLARDVVRSLGGAHARWLASSPVVGDCGAATGALDVAALVVGHRGDRSRDGERTLVLGWSTDGAVAAAVLRGYARAQDGAR